MNRIKRYPLIVAIVTLTAGLGLLPTGAPGGPVAHAAANLVTSAAGESATGPLIGPPPREKVPTAVHTVCLAGPPACQYSSVQAAVDAAGPDDVIKVAAGVYSDVHGRPAPPGYVGPAVITQAVYLSKTVSIRGGYTTTNGFADPPDPAAHPTTLDAQGQGRVLFVCGAGQPIVEGMRLTGGDASGLGGDTLNAQTGGGVYILSATATLSNNEIVYNTAGTGGAGGGVSLYRGAGTLRRNTIAANSAGSDGGGLYLWWSPIVLAENVISANTAITWGGGLYMSSSPALVEGNTVQGNSAAYGAGLSVTGCDGITVRGNTVVSNTAVAAAGMFFGYTGWTTPSLVLSNTFSYNTAIVAAGMYLVYVPYNLFAGNRISDNQAQYWAGVHVFSSAAHFDRNVFSRNVANGEGGAMHMDVSDASFTHNEFSENSALTGAGLYLEASAATLDGNTFYANSAISAGGGLYLDYSPATLIGNAFIANSSAGDGAGLWLLESDATLVSNTIAANSADGHGGGLYLRDSDALLSNNSVVENEADVAGSGLYITGSAPRLLHSTIARNRGAGGSGIHLARWQLLSSTAILTNTILVSHSLGIYVDGGCTASLEATLWGSGPWANEHDWGGPGTIHTGTLNLWEPPAFLDPAGGDYHLGPQSGAIDTGLDAGVLWDIDGDPRPIGAGYDIGADEFPASLRISKQASAQVAPAGAPLTYTLRVSNTGLTTLNATVRDVLPDPVTPTGELSWTAQLLPGDVWTEAIVVTVLPGYAGPLTNVVRIATLEGPAGVYTEVSAVQQPIAGLSAVNDSPTELGQPTTFTAAVTAGSEVTFTWSFGDGGHGSGAVITHTYPGTGTYTAIVTAANDVSQLTATTMVTITEPVGPAFYIYLPLVVKSP